MRAFLDRRNYMLTLSIFQLVLHSGSPVLGKNSHGITFPGTCNIVTSRTIRGRKLPHKAPSTQEQHKKILHDYVRARWGKAYVDEVRVLELKHWFMAIAKQKNLAAQSVQKTKQVFGRLYAYGYENELIAPNLNPVRACNIRGIGTKRKSKVIVVSPEIAWQIAMDLPILHRTLVLLAAATGMRISELLGLRWGDIEWDAQIIHINRTWLSWRGQDRREPQACPDR